MTNKERRAEIQGAMNGKLYWAAFWSFDFEMLDENKAKVIIHMKDTPEEYDETAIYNFETKTMMIMRKFEYYADFQAYSERLRAEKGEAAEEEIKELYAYNGGICGMSFLKPKKYVILAWINAECFDFVVPAGNDEEAIEWADKEFNSLDDVDEFVLYHGDYTDNAIDTKTARIVKEYCGHVGLTVEM